MKISVKNYKGTTYEGYWNKKTYDSKLEVEGLVRIYVDGDPIHITKETYAELLEDDEKANSEIANAKSTKAFNVIEENLNKLNEVHTKKLYEYVQTKVIQHLESELKKAKVSNREQQKMLKSLYESSELVEHFDYELSKIKEK